VSVTTPTEVKARVATALGGQFPTDLAWPAGPLTNRGLDTTVATGVAAVLVSSASLPGGTKTPLPGAAISPLPTVGGSAQAIVTDPGLQQRVAAAMLARAPDVTFESRNRLTSELALWPINDSRTAGYVVLAPDRYVDTAPDVAAAAILATVSPQWGASITVRSALTKVSPVDRGALVEAVGDSADTAMFATVKSAVDQTARLRDMLSNEDAATLLTGFSSAIARSESAAWRGDRALGAARATQLLASVSSISGAVALVVPSKGVYSLPSNNAPLVVTIRNDLPRQVRVRLQLTATGGVAGFSTDDLGVQTIAGGTTRTLQVPAHFERSGRFRIEIALLSPDRQRVGDPIQITVRTTAYGGIALVITSVAFAVLLGALLLRFIRRIRARTALRAAGEAVPIETTA
jgi:hypothetical protein